VAAIGPKGFSEPEETALATYIKSRGNVLGYIDFHSYSQLWMTVCLFPPNCTFDRLIDVRVVMSNAQPWGYTTALPKDYPDLLQATKGTCGATCDFVATIA
jgi:hypothetical protein